MKNQKLKSFFYVVFVLSVIFRSSYCSAEETTFEYPELSVVPRASERIVMEASRDREQGWKTGLPYLFPATMTLISGASLLVEGVRTPSPGSETSYRAAPYIGMGVGIAWWVVSLGIIDRQQFYQEGLNQISKLPAKTQKEQLVRERLAEESIHRAATLGRQLKWISVISNLATDAYLLGSAKPNSAGTYIAAGALISSLTPLIFSHRWIQNEATHDDYKKRIYAPVMGATLLKNPNGRSVSLGLSLALHF